MGKKKKSKEAWNNDTIFGGICGICRKPMMVDGNGKPVEPHICYFGKER